MNSSVDLCQVPAGLSPNGASNFDNPTSLAPALMAVMVILVVWAVSFTAARFYINIQKLDWADYLNLAALVALVAILGIQSTQLKVARHIWDVPACFFDSSYARGIYIPAVFLQIGAFFAKASIFLLFYQLFAIKKSMKRAIRVGLVFNFMLYGTGLAIATYYETPRSGEPWVAILDGRTLLPLRWWQIQSALSVALDFYIFVLPVPVIARLHLSTQRRIPIIAVFSLALLGIGASIASLVERIEITHSNDTTWISAILALCSFVELSVAIIVCSAPAFSTFARSHLIELSAIKVLVSTFSSSGSSFRSKSKYSEAGLDEAERAYRRNQSDASLRSDLPKGSSSQQIELSNKGTFESWVAADQHRVFSVAPAGVPENGILRTVGIEQAVRTTSTDGRMK